MEVVVHETGEELAGYAADRIRAEATSGVLRVLGVATGSSPSPVYTALAAGNASPLAGLEVFALDEYVGLPPGDPRSYHAVIDREITKPLGLDPARVHVPDGAAADLVAAARAYEVAIAEAGGVDLQILGIGTDGHIGFNEPSSSLRSRTRVKTLTASTRADNARFFDRPEQVPTHCLTQGLGTILDARRVLLVAQGRHKATAVAASIEGPLTAMCPGSVLQLHPDATIVLDREAASELRLLDYYRYVAEHKHAVTPTR